MCGVGSEDGDGIAGREGVNGRLVRIGVFGVVGRVRFERCVQVVVGQCDVLVKVLPCRISSLGGMSWRDMLQLTDCWVFRPIDTGHRQVAHLASPPKVEQGQAHDANFLIRTRRSTADKAGGVLAGTDLDRCQPAHVNGIDFSELTINTLRAAIVTAIGG
jgi:hypothetical protein